MDDTTHADAVAASDKAADKATDARAAADTASDKADDAAAAADAKPGSKPLAKAAEVADAAADKAGDKADAADVKAAAASDRVAEMVAAAEPALTLWRLSAKNRDEPPFHFTGVAHTFYVAALTEAEARKHVALGTEPHGAPWLDHKRTDCAPFVPREAGVVGVVGG
jgi:hypothetical protein